MAPGALSRDGVACGSGCDHDSGFFIRTQGIRLAVARVLAVHMQTIIRRCPTSVQQPRTKTN